jgi:hypothetical protein
VLQFVYEATFTSTNSVCVKSQNVTLCKVALYAWHLYKSSALLYLFYISVLFNVSLRRTTSEDVESDVIQLRLENCYFIYAISHYNLVSGTHQTWRSTVVTVYKSANSCKEYFAKFNAESNNGDYARTAHSCSLISHVEYYHASHPTPRCQNCVDVKKTVRA